MIVRIIHIYVAEDSLEAFRAATEANHLASIEESGVIRFDVLVDAEDPRHFVLYEVYADESAIETHKTTPHYAVWSTSVEPMMARPRVRTQFDVLAPMSESDW